MATEALENIMESTVVMDAPVFSREAFIEIAFIRAKQRVNWKDVVQLIKLIEINAVHVVWPNAFNLPWIKMVSRCFLSKSFNNQHFNFEIFATLSILSFILFFFLSFYSILSFIFCAFQHWIYNLQMCYSKYSIKFSSDFICIECSEHIFFYRIFFYRSSERRQPFMSCWKIGLNILC